jgi:peroxiredoxin Q/BCP
MSKKSVELGKLIPAFNLPATQEQKINLNQFSGKRVLIYFYPKDNTPGCTQQSKDFRDHFEEFKALNTVILGVSRDTISSHEKFKAKYALPFELISDTERELCQLFDVLKEKNMFGKRAIGIVRSTFLIDETGRLVHEWRNIKVPNHVASVLEYIESI